MSPRTVGKTLLLLAALAAAACSEDPTAPKSQPSATSMDTTHQEVRSEDKVLLLGSSVAGGFDSREAQAVATYAPGTEIQIATPDEWRAMTAQQFMSYRAIIIGDAACQSGTEAFQAAIDTRKNWGAIVDGDVAIIAADPSTNGTDMVVENGIRYVLNSVQRHTGMYIALGCAYQDAPADTEVTLLEPFGSFKVQGVQGCADSAHIFQMYNDFMSRDVWDGILSGMGGCAARTVFTSYPNRDFSYAGIAMRSSGEELPSQQTYTDFTIDPGVETPYAGAPYILVRGAMNMGAGCGIPEMMPGEECDLGDGLNGQPALVGQQYWETCSWACKRNWCGDGVVDREYGEECDNGEANGRTGDTSGNISNCTSFCKFPHPTDPATQAPIALCHNVTAAAEYTCGAGANIDDGSFDADNDLVDCVASPAGPYNIGDTTVTLTCTDAANHVSTCTSVVTVVDHVAPTVALNGPANQALECIKGGTYSDPGASASDQCDGSLLPTNVSTTGSVNLSVPASYTVNYTATDKSGNKSEPVSRTVTVSDTLAPAITVSPANVNQECGVAYTDQGVTANDQCEGSLTAKIVTTGTVNSSAVGNYLLRYDVKDAANHAAVEASRSVYVRDTRKPTVTLTGAASAAVECGGTYMDPGASASDECSGTLPVVLNNSTLNLNAPGTYSFNYRATDGSGNIGYSTNRSVTVSDTLPPTLALNGLANMALECATPFVDPGAAANDQCSGSLTSSIVTTGSVNNKVLGAYTLHYNVKDAKNNVAPELTRTVTVRDTQAPAITIAGQQSVAVECGGTYTDLGATASDACAGAVPAVATGSANPSVPGNYTITYSATDPSGNTSIASASRSVTVSDTLPPTLTLNGSTSSSLECGTAYADPGASANDQCAGALPVTVSGSVNNKVPASYTLHYSANDGAGHSISADRTVAVNDTQAPSITVNGAIDQTFECGGSYVDPGATASDACAGDLTAAIEAVQTGSSSQPGTFTITYKVTDPAGHQTVSPVQRTVHVNDSAPPTLALNGPATQALECGAAYTDPGASASDACFGDVTSRITKTGAVNSGVPGSYTLAYSVSDPSGQSAPTVSRTVSVSDTLAPSITVLGSLSQQVQCGSTYADPGATASDLCAGNLTAAIQTIGSVNTAAVGTYSLGYEVADPSGNSVTSPSTRSVEVVDTLAPTLSLVGGAAQNLECGTAYVDPGATASDSCAGSLTSSITKTGSVNSATPGSYALSYSVVDPSGNRSTANRTVTVRDTLAPQLQVNGGAVTLQCNGAPYVDAGATASDGCAGNLTSRIVTTSNVDLTHNGQYTVTYSVTDTAGNTSTASRQVTVAGSCSNSCIDVHLGEYNLFVQDNYTNGHDVVGKVAAGGNISMTSFSVGQGVSASNIAKTLVAGGNLTLSNGTSYGETWYGGTLSVNQSTSFPRGAPQKGTVIDFGAAFTELRATSARLASLTANGTTKRESWGGIFLTGTNTGVNVFDVAASAFSGAAILNIQVPSGSFVVINIRGASATFQNFGHSFSGVDQHNILYNFVDATTINATSYGFWGTVLAPNANVTFNNGSWDGGIYAKSFNGTAEGHINALNDRTICP